MDKKKTELVDSGVKLEDYCRLGVDHRFFLRWDGRFVYPPKSLNVIGVAMCNDGVWWVVER